MPECQDLQRTPTRDAVADAVPLSRASITNAAIDCIEEHGLGRLSMRALASALGCGTMSLYSHVRSRDDLVAAVVGELLDRSGIPAIAESEFASWQELIVASLLAYRDLAAEYPGSFELLALAPYDVTPVVGHLESLVAALQRAGVPEDRAYEVLGALDAYATGFLMVWARAQVNRKEPAAEASSKLKDLRTLEVFERGLQVFIEGFEREFERAGVRI